MITREQVKQYLQEGYTIVENVFGDNELDPVLNEFEEIVNDLAEHFFTKIKNKYENENVFKRLAKIVEFQGASVLIHHKGEFKPGKIMGFKKVT